MYLTAWVEIFALKKITSSSTDSQLLSNSMRRKHVLMNGSYELYLLLFMSRLCCDILLSTCRRKNPWCQRQNICQCHEKLCFGQRKGIFILQKKNYCMRSRINGKLEYWPKQTLIAIFFTFITCINWELIFYEKSYCMRKRVNGN